MSSTNKILVIDDDFVTLAIIEEILSTNGYNPGVFSSPVLALENLKTQQYDLILSDYFMPEMNGEEFLKAVRRNGIGTCFVFLTTNTNLQNAIECIKGGADDYIPKPIIREELLFRIRKNIQDKENEKIIEEVRKEKEILDLEREKLVNWRILYATKDIRQTEQLIKLLSRTINQSGGFLWLDLLKNDMSPLDEGYVKVSSALMDMVISSAQNQKNIFNYLNFISTIDTIEIDMVEIAVSDFIVLVKEFVASVLSPLLRKYKREFVVSLPEDSSDKKLCIDPLFMKRIIKELVINALKYSPEGTKVYLIIEKSTRISGNNLDIVVRNTPRITQALDKDGNKIIGIPYDQSELVFDLFYTIDAFPTQLEEEEWSDGTGLYVCRKLMKRQNGWISTSNGIDYTGDSPESFIRFTLTLPYA